MRFSNLTLTYLKALHSLRVWIRRLVQPLLEEVLVIGDSHGEVFLHKGTWVPGYWFKVVSIGGATISGLNNPNSKSGALKVFRRELEHYKSDACLCLLGEVDTGFVIWYAAKKHGLDVEAMLEKTVDNYIDFIRGISSNHSVAIISAPLPTILDGQDWGKVANARKEVTATLVQRTELTLLLNRKMEDFAADDGIHFINLDPESLGPDGQVKSYLLNGNGYDHHYDVDAYWSILGPKVEAFLNARNSER